MLKYWLLFSNNTKLIFQKSWFSFGCWPIFLPFKLLRKCTGGILDIWGRKQTHLAEQVYNPTNKELLNGMMEIIISLINSGQENMWHLTIWTIFQEEHMLRVTVGKDEPHKLVAKA